MALLQVIGGGKMGEALVGGLVNGGHPAGEVLVVERVEARVAELRTALPGVRIGAAPEAADGTVLAVKPADVAGVCRDVAAAGGGRVLSIAAGITLAALEAELAPGTPVVRAMPNTPALVGCGAAAIAGGSSAGDDDLAWAESILGSVGMVVRVDEALLDAVTGLSGSGPAYVFLVAEALIEAGVAAGLSRQVSYDLAVQTLLGAATLLARSDQGPVALREAVTSPNGTTAAGLAVLEEQGLRATVQAAVLAATRRSEELGRS